MYTRILVPLDGSKLAEQVVPYVRFLGAVLHSRVDLLQVIEPFLYRPSEPVQGRYLDQIAANMRTYAEDYLNKVAASLKKSDLTVSCEAIEGNPAESIVASASKSQDTLIAMSTHGRSGVTRWVLGSVTDKVLQAATCPLLIVRASGQEAIATDVRLKTVIVPLDGSEMAEQVLPHVVHLSKALALKVILARVTPSAEDYYRFAGYEAYPAWPVEDVSKEVDVEAANYLKRVAKRLRQQEVSAVEGRLLHGSAPGALVDLARDAQDSLVAITTHGRSGVGRWLLGSVASRVVRHSGGPVLVVRAAAQASKQA